MFFTHEDYRKIEKWLLANSRKDTDFVGAATPLKGNETVVLVQNGKNVKTSVKDIVDQFFLLGVSDFLNITDKYGESYITIDQAIQLIPFRSRKEGQVITFLNTDGNWEIYQFIGKLNQWNNPTLWNNPFDWEKLIIDSILPDEEDLTKSAPDSNGNAYLSLKDRKYEPDKYSGLGRVILRKNIVEIDDPIYGKVTKNILFQDMIAQSNTIYEIRYDFDLNGSEITIPEGCVLDFQGGSFANGTITGNNTQLLKNNKLINVIVKNIVRTEFDLFSFKKTSESYSEALQRIFDNIGSYEFTDIKLENGIYEFDKPVYIKPTSWLSPCISIYGNGFSSKIKYNGEEALININSGGGVGMQIHSLRIEGNSSNKLVESELINDSAPYFHYFDIHNCFISSFDVALDLKRGYSIILDRCQFRGNNIACKLNCANHTSITNCNFPYGNNTCIEFSDTEVAASGENASISVLVQGCRFEGMNIGIHLKSFWGATIIGCYFEPKTDGKTIVVNGSSSSLSMISNYGFYNKNMEIYGNIGYASFIRNNMSIKFMEDCTVNSIYFHNFDYGNFSISGITNDIAKHIYDDTIEYNQYSPKNIVKPNLLSVPETYNGEAIFDENDWTYTIASNIKCTAYFNLHNIDLGVGNQYQRCFQIINQATSEVLYEFNNIDPSFSTLINPIISIKKVEKVKLVVKCLTASFLSIKVPYSVTFVRSLYSNY